MTDKVKLAERLLPCPFCGGNVKTTYIGNEWTKVRKICVKCKRCGCEQTTGTPHYGFDWLESVAEANWNKRTANSE